MATDSDALVAACDMLVLRGLELVGKRLVRAERSRYKRMDGRPWYDAHLLWPPDRDTINKGLAEAWEPVAWVVDEHGCCGATVGQVTMVLDRYTRELLTAPQGHETRELRYRLAAYAGLPA